MPSKVLDEINYTFPNLSGTTVEIWEWISDFILHFIKDPTLYKGSISLLACIVVSHFGSLGSLHATLLSKIGCSVECCKVEYIPGLVWEGFPFHRTSYLLQYNIDILMAFTSSRSGINTNTSMSVFMFYKLKLIQNVQHLADDIFKCIFLNEHFRITNKISLKYALWGLIDNMSALVQIMAWCREGDRPLIVSSDIRVYICADSSMLKWIFSSISLSYPVNIWTTTVCLRQR